MFQVIFYWTLLARHVSQHFDADPSLKPVLQIEKQEQQQITLSQQQEDQIREIFTLFDTDGGGTIDRQELRIAMNALGFQSAKSQLTSVQQEKEQVLDILKSDGRDGVTLDEFTALMKGELIVADPDEEIKAIFAALSNIEEGRDPNHITLSKLRLASEKYEIRLSEDELELMINQIDEDGCGSIDEKEFIHVMRFSPWF